MPTPIKVHAEVYDPAVDDEMDGQSAMRHQFSLFGPDGAEYQFLVDLPLAGVENPTVDVWVLNCTVDIGDTSEDGFATFTPNDSVNELQGRNLSVS